MEVRVTIHGANHLEYRQGTTAAFVPVPNTPNDALVSTATQFRDIATHTIYKYTKGSWIKGAYYNVTTNTPNQQKFTNQNPPPESIVQYDS